jgi:hypothetical protein
MHDTEAGYSLPCDKKIHSLCKHPRCTYYNDKAPFNCLRQPTLRHQPVDVGDIAKWMGISEQQVKDTLAEAEKSIRRMILGTLKSDD